MTILLSDFVLRNATGLVACRAAECDGERKENEKAVFVELLSVTACLDEMTLSAIGAWRRDLFLLVALQPCLDGLFSYLIGSRPVWLRVSATSACHQQ